MARPPDPGDASRTLQLRTGRDLDQLGTQLDAWLATVESTEGVRVAGLSYVTTGGASNETLLVDVAGDASPELRGGLVVRLAIPDVPVFLDVDLHRQATIMRWVHEHTDVPVPLVVGVDDSCTTVDVPFMVTARLSGVAVPDFPSYNVSGFVHDLAPGACHDLWCDAIDTMAALHAVDATSLVGPVRSTAGVTDLSELVVASRALFEWAATSADVDVFAGHVDWLERTRPDEAPCGLSWGDARPGNMLFHDGACTAVLDWEFASLGGPLVDVGWWLLFDAVHTTDMGVPRLAGLPDRGETVERWSAGSGLSAAHLGWYVLAHVRLGLSRANGFAARRRLGLPVPGDDDPRSVRRLLDRLEAMTG